MSKFVLVLTTLYLFLYCYVLAYTIMDCLERREFFHERKIILQECERILSSFQTGKTPWNDGLPIEFYKTFWPLIGKLMTDSFNEAFDKKRNVFFTKASYHHTY